MYFIEIIFPDIYSKSNALIYIQVFMELVHTGHTWPVQMNSVTLEMDGMNQKSYQRSRNNETLAHTFLALATIPSLFSLATLKM